MLFKDKFHTQAIPERVYALCKAVEIHPCTRTELQELLEPKLLNNNKQDYFPPVLNTALLSGLVKNNDNKIISLNVKNDCVKDIHSFRKTMASIAFDDPENLFFRFTSWYLAQNEAVYAYKDASELSSKLRGDFLNIHKESVLGWRFWASFLGLGFLHGSFLIPNASKRILDQLDETEELKEGKYIEFRFFVDWLRDRCPEVREGIVEQKLSIALSSGLRLLHDQKKIQLHYIPDSTDVWYFHKSETHEFKQYISHIKVQEV